MSAPGRRRARRILVAGAALTLVAAIAIAVKVDADRGGAFADGIELRWTCFHTGGR